MKKKDKEELKSKTVDELKTLLKEKKESLVKISLDKVQNKLKNTRSIFMERKNIARILTVLKDKELAK